MVRVYRHLSRSYTISRALVLIERVKCVVWYLSASLGSRVKQQGVKLLTHPHLAARLGCVELLGYDVSRQSTQAGTRVQARLKSK
jgi:hypothetical protein